MENDVGVVYVVYGEPARTAAAASVKQLRHQNAFPIAIISDQASTLEGVEDVFWPDLDRGARLAKLNLLTLSPFDYTLYLDADTRPYQSLGAGFLALQDGFDLVLTPSIHQLYASWLWHCGSVDREATLQRCGYQALVLQAGLMFVAKNVRTHALFKVWRREWELRKDQDQAALVRALNQEPVKLWVFGRPWNGGAVVGHRHGDARRS